jgi:hypothetical protein
MEKLERVLTYLNKMPNAISGSGGDKATRRAAVACKRFGLSGSEVWTAMQWFNDHKCQPRWSEKDLRHKMGGVLDLHINKPLDTPAQSKHYGRVKTFVSPAPVVKKPDTRPIVQRSPQEEETWWQKVAIERGVTLADWDEVGEEIEE